MPADLPIVIRLPVIARRQPVVVAAERARPGSPGQLDVLSPLERTRCAAMSERRAEEFARGRTLLRFLAGQVLDLPAGEVPVLAEPAGRLRLAGLPCGVSLSHTDLSTVAAVWPGGDVGIDVEEPPHALGSGLLRRCCGQWASALDELPGPQRAAAFAGVWAAQEACVKALGLGLAGQPWRIPADPFARHGQWRDLHWYALDLLAPSAIAVAVRAGPPH